MKCNDNWSCGYYRPANLNNTGIYINNIAPREHTLYIAWYGGAENWSISYRIKDSRDEWNTYTVSESHAVIDNLLTDTDYEFFVSSAGKKSDVGYARTGFVPGTVVNYLHPDDRKYSFSGQHLCTPSILKHPDGYLLAAMDIFDGGAPQNLTLIFRSDDDGKSWYHLTELFPCFWGTLFMHKGEVYMLATSTEYGDLLIGRSSDGGKTWGRPTAIARGSSHNVVPGWHKSSMPVIEHKGRLWCAVDYGSHRSGGHMSCLASVDASSDILVADNWTITDPLKYSPEWEGAVKWDDRGFIEGNAVVAPNGELYNILRYMSDQGVPSHGSVGMLKANADEPEKKLEFYKFVTFDGNLSKFDIKRDEVTGLYFTIFNRLKPGERVGMRNTLSLAYSSDLESWSVLCDLLDYSHLNYKKVGFQYVSFEFDGNDIIYLSRTAFNGAQNFHDNNYVTFHRIEYFRELVKGE